MLYCFNYAGIVGVKSSSADIVTLIYLHCYSLFSFRKGNKLYQYKATLYQGIAFTIAMVPVLKKQTHWYNFYVETKP